MVDLVYINGPCDEWLIAEQEHNALPEDAQEANEKDYMEWIISTS